MRKPQERKVALEMAQNLLRRCRVVVMCGKDMLTDSMVCEIMLASRLRITTTTLDGIMAIQEHKAKTQDTGEASK
ncbi:hypothetical protein LJC60_06670 [Ruminococcaceae bacterium OttesenSCG-928-D13]|nr:hypothetical protein [Ruminococcaceae bacterium OttesenSCG-928-D13]